MLLQIKQSAQKGICSSRQECYKDIGMLEGNTDEGYIALGTGIGNIRSIKSVAEVVNELAIC
ncbi:hypothetical protein EC401_02860 [Salmonella enterica subsp. enterica serovar Oranienburg]|nr:hypothetical protein [Salmonella enterica subsp. enterica serovar Oranienburg]EEJ2879812.1 hypothetical protein [Salmonella enterica subsp. enterica]EGI5792929.1 hypothetical protein [Salmonella enterica subsp. enterica serovar Othmarschen]